MSFAAEAVEYFGIFLTPQSKEKLKQLIPAAFPQKSGDHLTIIYNPDDEQLLKLARYIGKGITLVATHVVQNNRVQAIRIKDVQTERGVPHVTISWADGASPAEANQLVATQRGIPLQPWLKLEGIYDVYPRSVQLRRYRRNVDEEIRDAQRRWEAGDPTSGVAYASHLMRSGQLSLTHEDRSLTFPIEILAEIFPITGTGSYGVPDGVFIYGATLSDIESNLQEQIAELLRQSENPPEEDNHLVNWSSLRQLAEMWEDSERRDTVIWNPDKQTITWRCNLRNFDRRDIQIANGEISLESLQFHYSHLQIVFKLDDQSLFRFPKFNIQAVTFDLYRPLVTSTSAIAFNNITLSDDVEDQWLDKPEIRTGRCEDFPCCGHDICPPVEMVSGTQIAMVCTCGALVPLRSSSSLCDGCLRQFDREMREEMYGEFEEPYDDEDEDSDEDDEDDEGYVYEDEGPPGLDELPDDL